MELRRCFRCLVMTPVEEFRLECVCRKCEKKNRKLWNKKNRMKLYEYHKLWKKRNPEKVFAKSKILVATKNGTLIRKTICEICGRYYKSMHGHHRDYNKPLEVIWCCPSCHNKIHNGEIYDTNYQANI